MAALCLPNLAPTISRQIFSFATAPLAYLEGFFLKLVLFYALCDYVMSAKQQASKTTNKNTKKATLKQTPSHLQLHVPSWTWQTLGGSTLVGNFKVLQCRDILHMGTAGDTCGVRLQGSGFGGVTLVRHYRNTSRVEHLWGWGWAQRRGKMHILKSNNPSVRVGSDDAGILELKPEASNYLAIGDFILPCTWKGSCTKTAILGRFSEV